MNDDVDESNLIKLNLLDLVENIFACEEQCQNQGCLIHNAIQVFVFFDLQDMDYKKFP